MPEINQPLEDMRALVTQAREDFYTQVDAALADIRERSLSIGRAVGEVSVDVALTALAGYARERIAQKTGDA